jgi:hypothetical protein
MIGIGLGESLIDFVGVMVVLGVTALAALLILVVRAVNYARNTPDL